MRFLTPPQTFAEAKWRQMPVYEVWAATAATVVTAAGTAYSAYSSSEAQKNNAKLAKASAQAQGQIAGYQNQLNYKIAMAQSQQHANNAQVLHDYARSQEVQGNEQINRSYQQEDMTRSATEAQYATSGIAGDTGSPLMVAAHNAGMAQLGRMDQAYKTNLAALDTDWKGTLETYQSQIQAEMAKQYQYGADVAAWQGGAMANYAYNNAMQEANNTATAGYINATGSLLGGIGQLAVAGKYKGAFKGTQ